MPIHHKFGRLLHEGVGVTDAFNRIIKGLSTVQEAELQRLIYQLQLSDGAPGTSTSTLVAPSSPDHISLMTLYFPYEINEHETFFETRDIVDGAMPH